MSEIIKRGVIDRIEAEWAIIDLSDMSEPLSVRREQIAPDAQEGDHIKLWIEDNQITRVTRDEEAIYAARTRIEAKLERLRRGEHLRPQNPIEHAVDNSEGSGDEY